MDLTFDTFVFMTDDFFGIAFISQRTGILVF